MVGLGEVGGLLIQCAMRERRIMANIPAFQASDVSSILTARTKIFYRSECGDCSSAG